MSPAVAACWSSLLLPSLRLAAVAGSSASSSTRVPSSSSSTGPASSTPTLTPSPYLLTDLHSAPSPRVLHSSSSSAAAASARRKYRRLVAHPQLRRLTTADDDSEDAMPRRKHRTTRLLELEVPALADAADQMLKVDAGAVSPRSIRNSLEETNVDMDGHVRTRKGSVSISWGAVAAPDGHPVGTAAAANGHGPSNGHSSSNSRAHDAHDHGHDDHDHDDDHGMNGAASTDDASASSASTSSEIAAMGPAAAPDFHEDEEPPVEYSSNPAVPANDAALAQLTGAQLWVHRLLATHHHTLRVLGLELEAFPNTRLSLKQLEAVMRPVITMCNLMTPAQFGIRTPSASMARTMSDVHYWKLWESDTIDIGIFFMPPGGVIPLHNHPGMSVVTRVLYGSSNVTSYDLLPKSQLAELPADEVQAGHDNIKWARVSRQGDFVAECTMWLDPRRFNLHQIRANDEVGCALLDIMIPPYNNSDRDCHHYEILVERVLERYQDRIVKLLESVQPDNHNEPTSTNPTNAATFRR